MLRAKLVLQNYYKDFRASPVRLASYPVERERTNRKGLSDASGQLANSREKTERAQRDQLGDDVIHDYVSRGSGGGAVLFLVDGGPYRAVFELGGDQPGNRRRLSPAAHASRL